MDQHSTTIALSAVYFEFHLCIRSASKSRCGRKIQVVQNAWTKELSCELLVLNTRGSSIFLKEDFPEIKMVGKCECLLILTNMLIMFTNVID